MNALTLIRGRAGGAARSAAAALLALALLNAGLYRWLSPPGGPQSAPAAPAAPAVPQAPAESAQQAAPQAEAGAPIYSAAFSGAPTDAGWTPFAGDWAVAEGRLEQRSPEGPDLGIGYAANFSSYRLRVSLRHQQGVGAGVLFNMPRADGVAGAHMARYTEDGAGIFWGYFDEQGVFQGQGFAPTAPAGQDEHTLEVASGAEGYAVLLDGAVLAENIPLQSRQGGIGLICSQSAASFGEIVVLGLEAGPAAAAPTVDPALAPTEAPLDALSSVSGDWVREGDALTQRLGDAADFTTATGVAAEGYTLNVTVEFPEGAPADAGGGVIFQMPGRVERAGAAMARLADGGRTIFWGRFDAEGVFAGAGSAELPEGDPARRALSLTVRAGSFDLAVDGKVVVKDVPLEGESGYIGLISFRGPVRFKAFQLALGE